MTGAQTKWIQVDPTKVDIETTATRKGVAFQVFISPYDLPEAVRGRFDPTVRRFVIEFRYLLDEPEERLAIDQHVTLILGTKSNRLLRIQVDTDGLGADQVALRINQAIDQLPQRLKSRVPNDNLRVAKRVLDETEPALFAAMAG